MQRAVPCGMHEILVGREQRQLMTNCQLGKQRVDRTDLNACSSAGSAEFCGGDMILAIGLEQRQRCKPFNDLRLRLGHTKALKKLLQHQPGGHDHIGTHEGIFEGIHFGFCGCSVTAKRERPHARIDQEGHVRERSAL